MRAAAFSAASPDRTLLMPTRFVALLITLLALHGCAEPENDFPREVFANAYAAAIDQGFTEAALLSMANLGMQNRGEPDLAARIQSNLPSSSCFEVDTPDSNVATLSSIEACSLAGRDWTGSVSFNSTSDNEFTVTYDATLESRTITGATRIVLQNPSDSARAKGELTTADINIERIVSEYATEFGFTFGNVTADDGEKIEGYKISGTASWSNATNHLWSSTMRETLVRIDSNVPHSGTRVFNVDGTVEFRMFVNALTTDSTDIVLRASGNNLRICVDENGSEACPSR